MAVKTRAQLKSENASDFPDNTARMISPADLRGQMDDIVDSALFPGDVSGVVVAVTGTTRSLSSADHNKILDFTNASGCAVTVPSTLTSGISGTPFTCGLAKSAAGNVTVAAGSGATVNAPGNLMGLGTLYGLMTLTEWSGGIFRLYGGTV
jgi:hypothetical protein